MDRHAWNPILLETIELARRGDGGAVSSAWARILQTLGPELERAARDPALAEVLRQLLRAQQDQDWLEFADLLESDLRPRLEGP